MPLYKCDCCGFTQDFVDAEAAFKTGWDAPPHFYGYVCCDLCPASNAVLAGGWSRHQPIHERWEQEGRPEEYSQETCVLEKDQISEEDLERTKNMVKEWMSDPAVAQWVEDTVQRLREQHGDV